MSEILTVVVIVYGLNLLPAFAPPTWTVLAYFALTLGMTDATFVATGILAASTGRWTLATLFRRYRDKLPNSYVRNMENAASHLTKSQHHARALLALGSIKWEPHPAVS